MEERARSAVVTGVGAGIGRAIFERLLADGWSVVGVEIDAALAAAAEDRLGDDRAAGRILVGDAGDLEVLRGARESAVAMAPLRGWVNNAAVVAQGTLHDADPESVRRLFKVNIEGYFWGCAEAVRTFLGSARAAPSSTFHRSRRAPRSPAGPRTTPPRRPSTA